MPTEKRYHIRVFPVLRAYSTATRPYPVLLLVSILGVLAVEASGIIAPLYLRELVDTLAGGAPTREILYGLFATLGIYALVIFGGWIGRRVSQITISYLEARVMSDLYTDSFTRLLRHSHEFFISNFTGTLTRRVTRYARSYEQVFDASMFTFLPAIIFAAGIIGVLSTRSPVLAAALLGWTTLFVYTQFKMAMYLQPLRAARAEADSQVTGALSDAVLNHSTVTAFATLAREAHSFGSVVSRWYTTTVRSWTADAWINGVQGILALLIEVGLLSAAVYFWQQGVVSVGDFVLIQVYILGLMDRVWGIGRNMRQLYDAFADATEMIDIIERPIDIRDVPDIKPLVIRSGRIAFDHVHFAYRDGYPILQDLDLVVSPHEKIALVGPSGSGKTTLTKLLLRLYDLTGGTIRIDGQNIADVAQESLRSQIAFVPQEPVLFHRTLHENIGYGRSDASREEVVEAARQAHCHEFISLLPLGYDTLVGERGVKLSGGERQRVAIARAILKNAPILVLDEATSSLDSESEALIQDALAKLMEGKTVIAIAHRLSTIMKMDRIIVMNKGRVVLTGTHAELLAQDSNLYKKLWEIQAGGFIES